MCGTSLSSEIACALLRVGGHRFLNHLLPFSAHSLLFLRLSPLCAVSRPRCSYTWRASDNVPNDVLFSRGDVDLPAGRKTVVAGALNLE